jgi:hypothetical protein
MFASTAFQQVDTGKARNRTAFNSESGFSTELNSISRHPLQSDESRRFATGHRTHLTTDLTDSPDADHFRSTWMHGLSTDDRSHSTFRPTRARTRLPSDSAPRTESGAGSTIARPQQNGLSTEITIQPIHSPSSTPDSSSSQPISTSPVTSTTSRSFVSSSTRKSRSSGKSIRTNRLRSNVAFSPFQSRSPSLHHSSTGRFCCFTPSAAPSFASSASLPSSTTTAHLHRHPHQRGPSTSATWSTFDRRSVVVARRRFRASNPSQHETSTFARDSLRSASSAFPLKHFESVSIEPPSSPRPAVTALSSAVTLATISSWTAASLGSLSLHSLPLVTPTSSRIASRLLTTLLPTPPNYSSSALLTSSPANSTEHGPDHLSTSTGAESTYASLYQFTEAIQARLLNSPISHESVWSNTTHSPVIGAGAPVIRIHHPWLAILLAIICLLVISGNMLIIMAVRKSRPLRQQVTNQFVASLAMADCLVGLLVMPFSAIHEVLDKVWIFGNDWCDLWHSCDVLASTSSILSLCVISIDRYWAITDPISYPRRMSNRKAKGLIALVWICSCLISFPAIFWWRAVSPGNQPYECNFPVSTGYIVFSSTLSFYGPLVVMVFVYYK